MNQPNLHPTNGFYPICPANLLTIILLVLSLSACNRTGQSTNGQRMRLSVGEIKEVAMPSRKGAQLVGTSENQEIVDVSQRPFTSADSVAMQQGQSVSTVFLVKGVSTGTAKLFFSDKTTGEDGSGRPRRTYAVQVVSQ